MDISTCWYGVELPKSLSFLQQVKVTQLPWLIQLSELYHTHQQGENLSWSGISYPENLTRLSYIKPSQLKRVNNIFRMVVFLEAPMKARSLSSVVVLKFRSQNLHS